MKQHRVPMFWIILIAMVFIIAAFDARAGGDRISQSNDMNNQTAGNIDTTVKVGGSTLTGGTQSMTSGDLVGGDVSVGGDKNRALALSLGDVDINDCYRSYQVSVLFQGSQLNYWCMADSLDAKGLHDAAAKTRCKLDGYRGLFDDEQSCIDMNTMAPTTNLVPISTELVDKDEDDDHRLYEAEIAALAEQLQQAQVQAKDAQRVAYNAKQKVQATPVVAPEVQKEIDAYEQRRIKAKAALEGDK